MINRTREWHTLYTKKACTARREAAVQAFDPFSASLREDLS